MSGHSAIGPDDSELTEEPRGRMSCAECRDEMEPFIERVLADPQAGGIRLREHLEMCAACSERYVHVLNLATSPMIRPLIGQPAAAGTKPPPGLCCLYRLQIGACNRWDDLNGLAVALAVVGTIRRHEGDPEDARRVQGLALARGRESNNALSQAISCLELALLDSDASRLEEATRWAERLGDLEIQERAKALRVKLRPEESKGTRPVYRSFFAALLAPHYALAAGGEKVIVVDNAREIPFEIVAGPVMDARGEVSLSLRIPPEDLETLAPGFTIDLIFVPTLEVLSSAEVGSEERWALGTAGGLELRCTLPHFAEFRQELPSDLPPEARGWRFPRSALCLRIRLIP